MYRKNTASQFFSFQGVDATTGGIKSGVTYTVRRCIDGTFAAATGTVTEDSTNGWYKFAMSQADTNGNNISFNFTGTGAVPQTVNIITDGSPPDVNLKNAAGTAVTLDANNVLNVSTKYVGGTLQTARDIGLSVLLSSGTGTGQVSLSSGLVDITQTAADKAWSTAARVLTAGTNIQLPSNGLANVTAWTVAITGNITGNLSGSVGSVTGAVGSVTGAVASVTGNVGGNVTGSVGSVVGAVGSVTGLTASNLDATISSRLATSGYTAPPTAAQNATAVLTTAMTESYAADGAAPTLTQAVMLTQQMLTESSVASTTLTVKKVDGSTSAATFTLSDATAPTSITRTT
jgi:hypothetical protein